MDAGGDDPRPRTIGATIEPLEDRMATVPAAVTRVEERRIRRFPWHIVVFLAPAVVVYTAFMVWPLLDTLRLSLFRVDEAGQTVFGGIDNHVRLLTDPRWLLRFWGAVAN